MHDGVGFADVLEELVAEAFAVGRAFHETGDVDELHDGGNRALGQNDLGEIDESLVGDLDHSHVRLDGTERVVRGLGFGGGQRVEQRGLSYVGQADNSEF